MPRGWSYGKKRESGYRSKDEENIAEWLTQNEIKFEYETLKLEYFKKVRKGYCQNCKSTTSCTQRLVYTPDFILQNGVIVEYKGRLTAKDRTKLVAVKESNPNVKIRLLFGSDNKLNKASKRRYSEWAVDNGFDYHVGKQIPRRWLRSV